MSTETHTRGYLSPFPRAVHVRFMLTRRRAQSARALAARERPKYMRFMRDDDDDCCVCAAAGRVEIDLHAHVFGAIRWRVRSFCDWLNFVQYDVHAGGRISYYLYVRKSYKIFTKKSFSFCHFMLRFIS